MSFLSLQFLYFSRRKKTKNKKQCPYIGDIPLSQEILRHALTDFVESFITDIGWVLRILAVYM